MNVKDIPIVASVATALLGSFGMFGLFALYLHETMYATRMSNCPGPTLAVPMVVSTTPSPTAIERPLLNLSGGGTKVIPFVDLTGLKRYLLTSRIRMVLTNPSLKELKYKIYCWLHYASERTVKEFMLQPREVREVEIDVSLEILPAKEKKPFRVTCADPRLAPVNQMMVMFTGYEPAVY